jgi:hypothetical protein
MNMPNDIFLNLSNNLEKNFSRDFYFFGSVDIGMVRFTTLGMILFFIWFCTIVSKKFSDHFLSSPLEEDLPFQDGGVSLEDIDNDVADGTYMIESVEEFTDNELLESKYELLVDTSIEESQYTDIDINYDMEFTKSAENYHIKSHDMETKYSFWVSDIDSMSKDRRYYWKILKFLEFQNHVTEKNVRNTRNLYIYPLDCYFFTKTEETGNVVESLQNITPFLDKVSQIVTIRGFTNQRKGRRTRQLFIENLKDKNFCKDYSVLQKQRFIFEPNIKYNPSYRTLIKHYSRRKKVIREARQIFKFGEFFVVIFNKETLSTVAGLTPKQIEMVVEWDEEQFKNIDASLPNAERPHVYYNPVAMGMLEWRDFGYLEEKRMETYYFDRRIQGGVIHWPDLTLLHDSLPRWNDLMIDWFLENSLYGRKDAPKKTKKFSKELLRNVSKLKLKRVLWASMEPYHENDIVSLEGRRRDLRLLDTNLDLLLDRSWNKAAFFFYYIRDWGDWAEKDSEFLSYDMMDELEEEMDQEGDLEELDFFSESGDLVDDGLIDEDNEDTEEELDNDIVADTSFSEYEYAEKFYDAGRWPSGTESPSVCHSSEYIVPLELSTLLSSLKHYDIFWVKESEWVQDVILDRFVFDYTDEMSILPKDRMMVTMLGPFVSRKVAGFLDDDLLSSKSLEFQNFAFKFMSEIPSTSIDGLANKKLFRYTFPIFDYSEDETDLHILPREIHEDLFARSFEEEEYHDFINIYGGGINWPGRGRRISRKKRRAKNKRRAKKEFKMMKRRMSRVRNKSSHYDLKTDKTARFKNSITGTVNRTKHVPFQRTLLNVRDRVDHVKRKRRSSKLKNIKLTSKRPLPKIKNRNLYKHTFRSKSSKKNVFLEMYHLNLNKIKLVCLTPYNSDFIKKTKGILGYASVPIIPSEALNNKFKREFHNYSEYYIKILNLKNYPELTLEEAERLWAALGCSREEWNSVDKQPVRQIMPYDNWGFPFFLAIVFLGFFDGGTENFVNYMGHQLTEFKHFPYGTYNTAQLEYARESGYFFIKNIIVFFSDILKDVLNFFYFRADLIKLDRGLYDSISEATLFEYFVKYQGSKTLKEMLGFIGYCQSFFPYFSLFDVVKIEVQSNWFGIIDVGFLIRISCFFLSNALYSILEFLFFGTADVFLIQLGGEVFNLVWIVVKLKYLIFTISWFKWSVIFISMYIFFLMWRKRYYKN